MPRPNNGPRLVPNKHGIFDIRWNEGGRSRRLSTQTRDRAVAQEALALWILGERQVDKPSTITVQQAWTLYWEEHVVKSVVDRTRLEYAWKRLAPEFAKRQLGELTTRDFLGYENLRQKAGAGAATVRRELSALAAAFNHLVRTKRVNQTDLPYFRLPDQSPPKDRWLTVSELDRMFLLAEIRRKQHNRVMGWPEERLSRTERFLHIAARTGARKRSIEKLTWGQVDLARRMIDFNPPGTRQTSKHRPVVPISDTLLPVLQRAHAQREDSPYVLDHSGSIRKGFDALCTAAGFDDVTPHTLRHTWASLAVMAGVPLVDVARVLGNSVPMVVRVYAKHAPEYLRTAVNFTPKEAA